MKNRRIVNGLPGSTSYSTNINLNEVRMVMIRKNSIADVLLRCLREHLLLYKLQSLLPPHPPQENRPAEMIGVTTEMDLQPHETPESDSDEVGATCANVTQLSTREDGEEEVMFESDHEVREETPKPFIPTIKLKRMDDSLMITTIVLKDVCLTSELFRVLEKEKLDIVFENQYRTETRVAYTIQKLVELYDQEIEYAMKKEGIWAQAEQAVQADSIQRKLGRIEECFIVYKQKKGQTQLDVVIPGLDQDQSYDQIFQNVKVFLVN